MDIEQIKTEAAETGVVAHIDRRTGTNDRYVALRADMDALPLNEETGLDFASDRDTWYDACMRTRRACSHAARGSRYTKKVPFNGKIKFIICHTRIKRSGAWWLKENCNAMLRVRCAIY